MGRNCTVEDAGTPSKAIAVRVSATSTSAWIRAGISDAGTPVDGVRPAYSSSRASNDSGSTTTSSWYRPGVNVSVACVTRRSWAATDGAAGGTRVTMPTTAAASQRHRGWERDVGTTRMG